MTRFKPAELRRLHSSRPHRSRAQIDALKHADTMLPKIAPGKLPEPPAFLRPIARAEFSRIVGVLSEMRMLTAADLPLAAAWSSAWADLVACETALQDGKIVRKSEGALRRSAWLISKQRATDQLAKLSAVLGFDPYARTRLAVAAGMKQLPLAGAASSEEADDSLEKWLEEGRKLARQ
jgi:P27 family predicted phage terminase small subunit